MTVTMATRGCRVVNGLAEYAAAVSTEGRLTIMNRNHDPTFVLLISIWFQLCICWIFRVTEFHILGIVDLNISIVRFMDVWVLHG